MKSFPANKYKHLKPFEEGVLCFVVARDYKGHGEHKLILHEARLCENGFAYGAGSCWATGFPKAKNSELIPRTKA